MEQKKRRLNNYPHHVLEKEESKKRPYPSNYCPISLTSMASKVLEHIIHAPYYEIF